MAVSIDVLNRFEKATGYDLTSYFNDFVSFMKLDFPYFVNYFSGQTNVVNNKSLSNLDDLLMRKDDIFSLFTHSKNRLNNAMFFDLLSQLEDIDTALMTASNISKWLRSPKTLSGFGKSIEVNRTLKQNQTLEGFNRKILNNPAFQDDWVKTAIRNDLTEDEYDILEGGSLLAVTFTRSGQIFVNSVVDNISGENILGVDIDQYTQFVDDDIKTLGYKETFYQSVLILSSLKQNDNPYWPDQGVKTKSVVGSNRNLLNLPSLFRQMAETFATDDTIKSFNITDVSRKQDGIFVTFVVKSILGDLQEFKQNLSN